MIIDKRKWELEIHSVCHNGNKMEYICGSDTNKRKNHTQRIMQAADWVGGAFGS